MSNAEVIKDFHSDKYQQHQADFVACKITLEHIPDTSSFVGLARHSLHADGTSLFHLQVPESFRILEHCAFEDIYYEHCNYFTPGSLARLFCSLGSTFSSFTPVMKDNTWQLRPRLPVIRHKAPRLWSRT